MRRSGRRRKHGRNKNIDWRRRHPMAPAIGQLAPCACPFPSNGKLEDAVSAPLAKECTSSGKAWGRKRAPKVGDGHSKPRGGREKKNSTAADASPAVFLLPSFFLFTFRGVLETAVDDRAEELGLQQEVLEPGGVDADVAGALAGSGSPAGGGAGGASDGLLVVGAGLLLLVVDELLLGLGDDGIGHVPCLRGCEGVVLWGGRREKREREKRRRHSKKLLSTEWDISFLRHKLSFFFTL